MNELDLHLPRYWKKLDIVNAIEADPSARTATNQKTAREQLAAAEKVELAVSRSWFRDKTRETRDGTEYEVTTTRITGVKILQDIGDPKGRTDLFAQLVLTKACRKDVVRRWVRPEIVSYTPIELTDARVRVFAGAKIEMPDGTFHGGEYVLLEELACPDLEVARQVLESKETAEQVTYESGDIEAISLIDAFAQAVIDREGDFVSQMQREVLDGQHFRTPPINWGREPYS